MSRIYKVKKVPEVVKNKFLKEYGHLKDLDLDFYTYKKSNLLPMKDDNKIYGCFVSSKGKLYNYSLQASEKWFTKNS